jgi:ankyrin repeat protein
LIVNKRKLFLEIFKDNVKKEKTLEFEAKSNMFNSVFFIFCVSAPSQKWSLPFSLLALAIASAKLYFSQRLGKFSDPDPTLKMLAGIMPIILLFLSGLLYSLVFVATYIQGYILLTISSVIVLNGFILFFKYFQKKKREVLRKVFYPTDEQQGKKESGFVFFTAVLTSWIAPCSIWANILGQKTWFLLISSSSCIVVYFVNIITIGVFEKLEYIIPTENPPVTRCFHEIDRYNSSKYRLFFSQNSTLLDIFKVCNNQDECQPAIRICTENENISNVLWIFLIPIGIVLLAITCIATLILQNLGDHHTFLKLLIKSGSIETNNFANAFNAFWKNRHFVDENIQDADELQQQMTNAVNNSQEKTKAVNTIFEILQILHSAQETITAANEILLITNLSILTSAANKELVWSYPIMLQAVEKKHYTLFSFLIFLGGECGTKNGKNISSINKLREEKFLNNNLLDNYNFITRWLITRALLKYQEFALHIASAKGNYQEIERLIVNGYSVNLKNNDHQTPLHLAAGNGHFEIVKYLVVNDANIESKGESDQTPVCCAVEKGHYKIVKYLVNNNASIISRIEFNNKPLNWASKYGHFKIVKYLVKNQADIESKDENNQTPLHLAAGKGHYEIVKYLVENSAEKESKDEDDQTPLHKAADNGHFEIVKYLVENQADKESKDWNIKTPLHIAAENGHLEIVKYLVENGADKESKNYSDQTPLHFAALNGHFEIVKYLVENGAYKESKDERNHTPLHLASDKGHLEIAKYLVEKGADKESKDISSQTPLHLAARKGHFEIVKYLVENHADKESKDKWNRTPLYIAAENGHLEIVKYLVENNADKDSKSSYNQTPLHFAAKNGHFEIVKYLVEKGANIQAKTQNGETPVDLADIEANNKYVRFFKEVHLKKIVQFLKQKESEK